ncbi:MAG: hypothetical protein M1118_15350 [Chloroflexi bacterium]|nr:hypothetical protein [Chloroflexota bacterium]
MGKAVLHLHSMFSDGRSSVRDSLDRLALLEDIAVVSFTDHDEVSAWEEALRWKDAHPRSSITPLWGCEVTVQGFKHILAYFFSPPYPAHRLPTLRPLPETVQRITDAGGIIVVAHPDQWVVGVGLKPIEALLPHPGIVGLETHSPYVRSPERLAAFARTHRIASVGGSDAHFPQHLMKWFTEFPGEQPADLEMALRSATTVPRQGPRAERVPLSELLLQQVQSLVIHPFHKATRHTRFQGVS